MIGGHTFCSHVSVQRTKTKSHKRILKITNSEKKLLVMWAVVDYPCVVFLETQSNTHSQMHTCTTEASFQGNNSVMHFLILLGKNGR